MAAASGLVHYAGSVAGTPWVTIDAGAGRLVSVGPVTALVERGDPVVAGQVIGVVATDAPIHWGMRINGVYVDPLAAVPTTRPRLVGPGEIALVVDRPKRYP